jgi:truncated hemoglobin YjbI
MSSSYERLGGEAALRAIISDFIDRVCVDIMIGFLFRKVDRDALKELEFQHAAEHLGAEIRYRGRPLHQAHAQHRILGGQFSRRKELLRQALVRHQVPSDIIDTWLAYTESLREQITRDEGGECRD